MKYCQLRLLHYLHQYYFCELAYTSVRLSGATLATFLPLRGPPSSRMNTFWITFRVGVKGQNASYLREGDYASQELLIYSNCYFDNGPRLLHSHYRTHRTERDRIRVKASAASALGGLLAYY